MLKNLKKRLLRLALPYLSSFYVQAISVFIGMSVSDYLWVRTIHNVAFGSAFTAASWSTAYATLSAALTISFIHDKRLVVPYMLGAFIGTYLAV